MRILYICDVLLLALFSLATGDSYQINQKHQWPLRHTQRYVCVLVSLVSRVLMDSNRFADVGGEDFQSHDCVVPALNLICAAWRPRDSSKTLCSGHFAIATKTRPSLERRSTASVTPPLGSRAPFVSREWT